MKIKKGDIVGRYSYNNDILFTVEKILTIKGNQKIAILKGLFFRIEADAPIEDLKLAEQRIVTEHIERLERSLARRIEKCLENGKDCIEETKKLFHTSRSDREIYTGRILHLDGDKRYSDKSLKYYEKLGLDAIVKNVPENRQPKIVVDLLERYHPDILVVTGHDGMIKKGTGFHDVYNYRNSRHFVRTVEEARKWERDKNQLAIFAGACQSYYEAIIGAGANFASSPARILIDFVDPLVVAQKIALTDNTRYIGIRDIEEELRDGEKGISGIGSMGKKKIVVI